MEGIGLPLHPSGERMFLTDLGGSVYSATLDGSNKKMMLVAMGNLTAFAYVDLPVGVFDSHWQRNMPNLRSFS
jgi:hypothetical protein